LSTSYRGILRSSSIIGGASIVNVVVGLIRNKAAALLLGPEGVGLIGLFQSLIATASAVSSMGLGNVGTRQIAEAVGRDDEAAVAASRRALFWGTLALAVVGAGVFWLLHGILARRLLGDTRQATAIGWLALGVALTVATGSQGALLYGLRRIGDIARVTVFSSVLSTALGLAVLWVWGGKALWLFVIATPLASLVLGHIYVARLPKITAPRTPLPVLMSQWAQLARLGAAFMVAGVVVNLGQLAVRAMVHRQLGDAALGQFQAAATISMTYIAFVLGAMSADYYPRLCAAIHEPARLNQMVNEQTEVALLLAGPVFLAMLGLAPWVIDLLYSSRFALAATVLRWQILGDVIKVASWPLGYVILAYGDARMFVLTEAGAIAIFAGLVWLGLPLIGIQATGVAFAAVYVLHLPAMYFLAYRRTGFSWRRKVAFGFLALLGAAIAVFLVGAVSRWWGAAFGAVAALAFGVHGLARLGEMAELGGALGQLGALARRLAPAARAGGK